MIEKISTEMPGIPSGMNFGSAFSSEALRANMVGKISTEMPGIPSGINFGSTTMPSEVYSALKSTLVSKPIVKSETQVVHLSSITDSASNVKILNNGQHNELTTKIESQSIG